MVANSLDGDHIDRPDEHYSNASDIMPTDVVSTPRQNFNRERYLPSLDNDAPSKKDSADLSAQQTFDRGRSNREKLKSTTWVNVTNNNNINNNMNKQESSATVDHVTIDVTGEKKAKSTPKKWKLFKSKDEKGSKDNKKKDGEEEEKEPVLPPIGMIQLFRYANRKECSLIVVGILAAVIAGLCLPFMIILFGDITNAFVYSDFNLTVIAAEYNTTVEIVNATIQDMYFQNDFFSEVIRFAVGTAFVGFLQLIMGYVFVTCLNYAAEGQVYRIRTQFLRATLRQEMGWFDTHKTNSFASKVTENLNKLQEGIGEKIGMLVFFFVTFVASLVTAFIYGWELTLVILSVFPLLVVAMAFIAKIQSNLTSQEMAEYARAGSIAEEVLSGLKTVLAFGGENRESARYEKNLYSARAAGVRRGMFTGLSLGFVWLLIYASYSVAFWYGTELILESRYPNNGPYDPGVLIIVFFSVLMGAMNMGQAAPFVESFNIARGAAASIYSVLERTSLIDPLSPLGLKPSHVSGRIEFRGVSFKYPSRLGVSVLQRLSLTVLPGQTVALVGASGCGKSTCIQLLQRFYDPNSGEITLDGTDIRELNIGWLRDQVGVVGQEPVLFSTTIEENIRLGRTGVSFDDVIAAAKEANAHDFIMTMPKNYQTQVGERGAQMSGGQKQRLAIARALVRKPKVLLLDEATSALDNQSEAVVQQALDKARQGRTTIIVAHRLTTIRSADVIVALQDGAAVEQGSHDELMMLRGIYHTLVTAQLAPGQRTGVSGGDDELSDVSEYETATELEPTSIIDEVAKATPVAIGRLGSRRRSSSVRKRRASSIISTRSKSVKKTATSAASVVEEDGKNKEKLPELPMMEILQTNKPEWLWISLGVLGSMVQGCIIPLYAILFGDVLGTLSIAEASVARSEANFYALLFLGIGFLAAVSVFFQSYCFALSGERLTMRLRRLTFRAMLRQEVAWYDEDENAVGALCSKLSGDAAAVQGATGSRLGTITQAITTLTLSLGMSLYFNWKLGLVCVPFIPVVLVAVYLQSKMLMGQSITESKVLEKAGKIAVEAIGNVRTVASLHKEEEFSRRYANALLKPHEIALRNSHLRGAAFGFAQAVPFIAYSVVMLYGGYLVENEGMAYEDVFKVAEALLVGTMMVGQAVAFAPNYSKGKVAAARIFKLLKRVPTIPDSSVPAEKSLKSTSFETVEFEKIHFRYPSRPDVKILQGLSLEVGRGRTLALVGASGCGKSTIINLLQRFYDPNQGQVIIDKCNIRGVNVGSVRRGLGLVSQEPTLFDISIEENIAYGDNSREVTHEEVVAAARMANISDFINSLPDGYKTRAGSKGTQLSGGQKQRIAIARALIRNPSVLLLDEATSALDTESEKMVQEALDKAQEGRTSIVIAHRLSTVRGADSIAVFSSGRVVEQGTHDELIARRGEYYKLYQTHQ